MELESQFKINPLGFIFHNQVPTDQAISFIENPFSFIKPFMDDLKRLKPEVLEGINFSSLFHFMIYRKVKIEKMLAHKLYVSVLIEFEKERNTDEVEHWWELISKKEYSTRMERVLNNFISICEDETKLLNLFPS